MSGLFLRWNLFLLICLPGYVYSAVSDTGSIRLTIGDFVSLKGKVIVLLYDSVAINNLKAPAFKQKTVNLTQDRIYVEFDSVPVGMYAVAVIHDKNENGRNDYFTEDYGYSNGVTAESFKPTRKKAAFYFGGDTLDLFIRIENELAGRTQNARKRTRIAPVFAYTPETSLLFGVNYIRLFRPPSKDSSSRTSYVDFFAAGTLKKQFIFEQNYTVFSRGEKYMFIGYSTFQKYPQYYYGVGNDLPASNKEEVDYSQLKLDQLALRNVYKKIYVGAGFRFSTIYNVSSSPTGVLLEKNTVGANGSLVSGLQFAFSSDNRNSIYNASTGHLVRIKTALYRPAFGSRYNFSSLEIDLRKFIKPFAGRKDVLAVQFYGFFSFGNVPWSEMGALGSDMIMRGYYSGRYRDKEYAAIQAEYRLNISPFLGFTFFAGTGEVSQAMKNFSWDGLKPNAGVGYRLSLDRQERINLRIDLGYGKNISNVYVTVTEAF